MDNIILHLIDHHQNFVKVHSLKLVLECAFLSYDMVRWL